MSSPRPSPLPPPSYDPQMACLQQDPELFFSTAEQAVEEAKAICQLCPVRESCLRFALAAREEYGVWGGTTPQERRRILAPKIDKGTRRRRRAVGPGGRAA